MHCQLCKFHLKLFFPHFNQFLNHDIKLHSCFLWKCYSTGAKLACTGHLHWLEVFVTVFPHDGLQTFATLQTLCNKVCCDLLQSSRGDTCNITTVIPQKFALHFSSLLAILTVFGIFLFLQSMANGLKWFVELAVKVSNCPSSMRCAYCLLNACYFHCR